MNSISSAGETHAYQYDLAGNRLITEYGGTTRKLESAYNAVNWLEQVDEIKGATTRTTAYQLDLNGNITKQTLPGSQVTDKAFDELNRVTQIGGVSQSKSAIHNLHTHYTTKFSVNGRRRTASMKAVSSSANRLGLLMIRWRLSIPLRKILLAR